MSNSSRNAFLDFGLRLEDLLAFFPNAPAAPPRPGPPRPGAPLGARPGVPAALPAPPAPPAPGPLERYGPLELGAPVPVRGGNCEPGAPPLPAGRGDEGRAANPGRTEPGRGPDIPGRGAPLPCEPCGRAGGRGTAPPVENGLLPGRGGRGTAPPVVPEENGLLPGRAAGFGVSVVGVAGVAGVAGFAGVAAALSSGICGVGATTSAAARDALRASRSTPSSAANSAASAGSTSALFLAALFFAAAFLTGFFSSTGFASGYSAINLRTTGASTVDDAERTNSPISWSFARTSLLSMPSCFANSCTRTFDTFLLSWPTYECECEP